MLNHDLDLLYNNYYEFASCYYQYFSQDSDNNDSHQI
jgi:hypothetical protein